MLRQSHEQYEHRRFSRGDYIISYFACSVENSRKNIVYKSGRAYDEILCSAFMQIIRSAAIAKRDNKLRMWRAAS